MKPLRKEKSFCQKISRWDRIRKRNVNKNSFSFNSDFVHHLFGEDYIKQHNSVLCGRSKPSKVLSPLLVMDMRHEMFRKRRRNLPLVTVGGQRTLGACISHNLIVEDRYITNELNKFRQQLQKSRKRNTLEKNITEKAKRDIYSLDHKGLVQSLERSAKNIENFYSAPLDALKAVEALCEVKTAEVKATKTTTTKNENIENPLEVHTNGHGKEDQIITGAICKDINFIERNRCNLIPHKALLGKQIELQTNQIELNSQNHSVLLHQNNTGMEYQLKQKSIYEYHNLIAINVAIDINSSYHTRFVHFDKTFEGNNFNGEISICSNTSDGINSVTSDITEEELFEIKTEAKDGFAQETEPHLDDQKSLIQSNFDEYLNGIQKSLSTEDILEPLIIKRLAIPDKVASAQFDPDELEEESISNHEQNLIIAQLFQSRATANHTLLQKYFLKWIHFITIEKIEREDVLSKGDRIHKINLFLDKIRKDKLRLTQNTHQFTVSQVRSGAQMKPIISTQVNKKYQNKIKIQQDIIDLQRLKLERQERLIMELKLNKLSDETKDARQDLKNELKCIIRYGDQKFKAKAKCLNLIGNLRDRDDENMTSLQGKAMLMPTFLLKMQERALERNIRHEKAHQRRLQQEAEKEAQKMAAEEAKRLEDEEAKRLRIEALKEKRRQEKMAKVLKEREHQRAVEAKFKADEFYRRFLLRRVGMEAFKKLIQRKRKNNRICEQFRQKIIKRTCFLSWRDYYLKLRNEKLKLADELYEKLLKKKTLNIWQFYVQEERSKFNVAVDWCDLKRADITFKSWAQYSARMSAIDGAKMNQAMSHHGWHLKWKVLDCWQRLPQILQLERETEERRQRWRMKIWELLPDYTPNTEDVS